MITDDFKGIYESLPANGWLFESEAKLLWETAQLVSGPILEVGCYYGRSTVLLASVGSPVYAVDPFSFFDSDDESGDNVAAAFASNLASRGIENVKLFRVKVEDWFPLEVGLAYLDGDHTYQGTLNQIDKAMLSRAKVIAIHDVNDSGEGAEVKRAAVERLGQWDIRVERMAVWHGVKHG